MLKPRLSKLFEEYSESHRNPTNRLTHKIAIPLIVFHIVAMLDWVALFTLPGLGFSLTLGHLACIGAVGWYLSNDVKLGLLMAAALAVCFPIGWHTPRSMVVAIAVAGWLIQLAGHVVWEKKQPSFLTNLVHALVGPFFFIAVLVGEWPQRQAQAASSRPA